MTIYLVRHGKPTVSLQEKVNGDKFLDFLKRYDAARDSKRLDTTRKLNCSCTER